VSEWQPIATAPKDGRRVLVYAPEWGDITCGEYHTNRERDDRGRFQAGGWAYWLAMDEDYRSSYCHPTHWMPLPEPPKAEGSLP
jgi:hypothetical protein